jgi:type II secretory pathway component PulF
LAGHYHNLHTRYRTLGARLLLPGIVLLLALLVRRFPDLLTGGISLSGFLANAIGQIFALTLGAYLTLTLLRRWRQSPRGALLDAIGAKLPLLGTYILRRNRLAFLESLSTLLDAGLPALEAWTLAQSTVPNSAVHSDLDAARGLVERGQSLHRALLECRFVSPEIRHAIQAAETAGRLSDELRRVTVSEQRLLETLERQLLSWIPRMAYFLIGAWIASGIIG